MKDLIVISADGTMKLVLESLLMRFPDSSNTRPFTYDVIPHPNRDPGCLNDAHELLQPFSKQYKYAVVIFDFEGCGCLENELVSDLETKVQLRLDNVNFKNRSVVVVINPELESWIWQDNIHVEKALGWYNGNLYASLLANGLLNDERTKPLRPKETMQSILRQNKIPFSSSIHKKIAESISYKKCTDRAFLKLIASLQSWFCKNKEN